MWETKSHSFSEFTFELKFAFRMVLLYHTWGAYILQQGTYISNFLVLFWMHYFITNNQYWAFPYYILLLFFRLMQQKSQFSFRDWVSGKCTSVCFVAFKSWRYRAFTNYVNLILQFLDPFFLWVCWFLGKNLSNFVPPARKLHNPYCHNAYCTFPGSPSTYLVL